MREKSLIITTMNAEVWTPWSDGRSKTMSRSSGIGSAGSGSDIEHTNLRVMKLEVGGGRENDDGSGGFGRSATLQHR